MNRLRDGDAVTAVGLATRPLMRAAAAKGGLAARRGGLARARTALPHVPFVHLSEGAFHWYSSSLSFHLAVMLLLETLLFRFFVFAACLAAILSI